MEPFKNKNVLLVGYPEEYQVGLHFYNAAKELGVPTVFVDANEAFKGNKIIQSFLWHFWGKYPQNMSSFSHAIMEKCKSLLFSHLITVGICPVILQDLIEIGKMGVKRVNFLTDDPWNRVHHAKWFMKALEGYNKIYSPRTSNLMDLKNNGFKDVDYLPFAYAPCHLLKDGIFPHEGEVDVVFVGGGDLDRYPFALRLQEKGIHLALYGAGWEKFPALKTSWKGKGNVDTIRSVSGETKVTLCLVRKANRDGHVMRSFEAAASGACMLVEDTREHRQIFGPDGECVIYFSNIDEMEEKALFLLSHPEERSKLRKSSFEKITNLSNQYSDRLKTILGC